MRAPKSCPVDEPLLQEILQAFARFRSSKFYRPRPISRKTRKPRQPREGGIAMRSVVMDQLSFDCDCDRVIEMEDMGIGVEEILQYARAVLPREQVRALIRGLEQVLASGDSGKEA